MLLCWPQAGEEGLTSRDKVAGSPGGLAVVRVHSKALSVLLFSFQAGAGQLL